MDYQYWEQQDSCPSARFSEKGCLPVLGGDALRATPRNTSHKQVLVEGSEQLVGFVFKNGLGKYIFAHDEKLSKSHYIV